MTTLTTRRRWLLLAGASLLGGTSLLAGTGTVFADESTAPGVVTVYKSPTCGCCSGWVDYLRDEGFTVETIDTEDLDPIKALHGLTDPSLKSCHTALVDGYVVEGHVPADDIRRLLAERPADVSGITAPGMPMLSPGMASREPKDYTVYAFSESGAVTEFSRY